MPKFDYVLIKTNFLLNQVKAERHSTRSYRKKGWPAYKKKKPKAKHPYSVSIFKELSSFHRDVLKIRVRLTRSGPSQMDEPQVFLRRVGPPSVFCHSRLTHSAGFIFLPYPFMLANCSIHYKLAAHLYDVTIR